MQYGSFSTCHLHTSPARSRPRSMPPIPANREPKVRATLSASIAQQNLADAFHDAPGWHNQLWEFCLERLTAGVRQRQRLGEVGLELGRSFHDGFSDELLELFFNENL